MENHTLANSCYYLNDAKDHTAERRQLKHTYISHFLWMRADHPVNILNKSALKIVNRVKRGIDCGKMVSKVAGSFDRLWSHTCTC
jgi:hypothetical protein